MIIKRTILKQDLIKKLYPDSISVRSALQQLRNELDQCPELKQKIAKAGRTRRHYYNNNQLAIILEHFSISKEDFEKM